MSSTTNPRQTRLANIPEEAIKGAFKGLGKNISPEDNDEEIRGSLQYVWLAVQGALEQDLRLKKHLADKEEFFANIKRNGEKQFIELLRDMAKNSSWGGVIRRRYAVLLFLCF
jgi:hypothetical protein